MTALFIKLVNMSIVASWLVLAVVLLRLVLRRAPKVTALILWALVGVRLILPFSPESVFSLIPDTQTIPTNIVVSTDTPTINTLPTQSGAQTPSVDVTPTTPQTPAVNAEPKINIMEIVIRAASGVWAVGVGVMLCYAFASYIKMKRTVRESVHVHGNIMVCDNIPSPFILGIIKPKIYIPSSTAQSDTHYVLAHEKAHLKRLDHIWKPLGFLLLSVYWFNPMLWVAYILLCRDIELACDEKVIRQLGMEVKKPYSTALVNCSVTRRAITACPLAFGEVGVKKRVKTVLKYKKPTFLIIAIALIICVAFAGCFLTNPQTDDSTTTTTTQDTTTTTKPSDTTIQNTNTRINFPTLSEIIAHNNNIDKKITNDVIPRVSTFRFDVDADGRKEFCTVAPDKNDPYNLFHFIVTGSSEDVRPEHYTAFSYDGIDKLEFTVTDEGRIVLQGRRNGTLSTFDISVENGKIILNERGGGTLPSVERAFSMDAWAHRYSFDYPNNSICVDIDGDGKDETIFIGCRIDYLNERDYTNSLYIECIVGDGLFQITRYSSIADSYIEKGEDGKLYMMQEIDGEIVASEYTNKQGTYTPFELM